jgi:chromosome segregation ATPase
MALGAQLKERENRILDLHGAQKTLEAGYQEKIEAARQLETAHKLRADKAENAKNELQDRFEAASSSLAVASSQQGDLQARLVTAEHSRDQMVAANAAQVALLARDLESEKGKVLEVIQANTRLASEVTVLKSLIEEREGRIRVLEAEAT